MPPVVYLVLLYLFHTERQFCLMFCGCLYSNGRQVQQFSEIAYPNLFHNYNRLFRTPANCDAFVLLDYLQFMIVIERCAHVWNVIEVLTVNTNKLQARQATERHLHVYTNML